MSTSYLEPESGHPVAREALHDFQSMVGLLVPGCSVTLVPGGEKIAESALFLPAHFPPDLIPRLHKLAGQDGPGIGRETAICLSEDGTISPVPISPAQSCHGEILICFRTVPVASSGRPPALLLYQAWTSGPAQLESMILAARLGSGLLAMDARLPSRANAASRLAQPARGAAPQVDLQQLLKHIPDLLVLCDAEGRIVYISPSVEFILGLGSGQLAGANWLDLQHPEDRANVASHLSRHNGQDAVMHHRMQRGDGKWRHFESRVIPAPGPAPGAASPGSGPGFLLTAQDITERLMLQQVLRDTTTEAVAQRAAAERARLDAESANTAKNEFLSRMSHELRTPLNAVLGFAQLLQRAPLAANHHQMVEYILTAGRHLLDLINEILDISRIEAGQLELNREPVDTTKAARLALELMQPDAENAQVQLILEELPGKSPPAVLADQQRLNQILLNLISNAIKYNRPGGQVRLRSFLMPARQSPEKPAAPAPASAPQSQLRPDKFRDAATAIKSANSLSLPETKSASEMAFVELQVEDTGPGIAPEFLDRIFVPFDRLGAERRGIEGTGIGLALARSLAEAMDGTLTVTSRVGQGTCFHLRLPRAPLLPRMVRQPGQKGAGLEGIPPVNTQWIVLCLESDATNLQLIHRVLALRPEIRIMTASEWEAGLLLACRHRPDAILLDWHLHGEGQDLVRQLKEQQETRDIPVLVVSAAAHPGDREAAMRSGASHFIAKPYEIEDLLQALDVLLPIAPPQPEALPEPSAISENSPESRSGTNSGSSAASTTNDGAGQASLAHSGNKRASSAQTPTTAL